MSEKLPSESQDKIIVFGVKQIRRAWVDGEWFFSVVDIVGALTDSPNPRNYWSMMKAREKETSEVQLSTICVQLKLTSADGKRSKLNRATVKHARCELRTPTAPAREAAGVQRNHAPVGYARAFSTRANTERGFPVELTATRRQEGEWLSPLPRPTA